MADQARASLFSGIKKPPQKERDYGSRSDPLASLVTPAQTSVAELGILLHSRLVFPEETHYIRLASEVSSVALMPREAGQLLESTYYLGPQAISLIFLSKC